ncbi:DsbA family protein [Plantibacter sp. CFBP 8804]|uniref:DsbA family protein n=1 Tax=Plantibacter sp. CFBP 8804 TaxID=2775270 RepID=UPI00177C79D0|nr:thioredoxin domain-containing protein [Plantibacter sp. CFBP 8804]MBD8516264.1 thioredoxin domain-containing protein [Plantibacter sp. CFBP 8804]
MSGAGSQNRPTKNERRDAAREKARVLREQQKRRDRRNRVLLQGGIVLGALAIVAVVAVIIVTSIKPAGPVPTAAKNDGFTVSAGLQLVGAPAGASTPTPSATNPAAPAEPAPAETPAATETPAADGVEISVYQDFLCPYCGQFETTNAEQVKGWLEAGAATYTVHPLATLSNLSLGTQYSLRASNAAACVAEYSPNDFFSFNTALFENQPKENTEGLTDAELKSIAKGVISGGEKKINACIDDGTYKSWVKDSTDRARSGPLPGTDVAKVEGTPTILVNGKQYTGSLTDAEQFAAFVLAVSSESYSTGTPTPGASESPVTNG